MSTGDLVIYDCGQLATLRTAKVSDSSISALAFHPSSLHQLFVASLQKLSLVQISPKLTVKADLETYAKSSKKASATKSMAAVKLSLV